MSCRDSHPVMCGPSNFHFRKSGHRLIRNQRSRSRFSLRHIRQGDSLMANAISYRSIKLFRRGCPICRGGMWFLDFWSMKGKIFPLWPWRALLNPWEFLFFPHRATPCDFLFFFSAPFLCACLFSFSIFSSCSSLLVNLVSPYTEFFLFFYLECFFFFLAKEPGRRRCIH